MYHSLSIHLLKDIFVAPIIGNYELGCYKHSSVGFCVDMFSPHLSKYQGARFLDRMIRIRNCRTSLMAQWLRIRLPMQGTQVQSLVWEDPTCCGATKPSHHNC